MARPLSLLVAPDYLFYGFSGGFFRFGLCLFGWLLYPFANFFPIP